MPTAVKKPSWVPILISSAAIFGSLGIVLLPSAKSSILIYLAYLFTPLTPILMLMWARVKDNVGRSSIFFDIGKSQTVVKVSSLLALLGFVVAVFVVWEIANRLAIVQ